MFVALIAAIALAAIVGIATYLYIYSKKSKPKVYFIKIEGCTACDTYKGQFESLVQKYPDKFSFLDARSNFDFCQKHGVDKVPTVLKIKNGVVTRFETSLESLSSASQDKYESALLKFFNK